MFREELLDIVNEWSVEQLTFYIKRLETRITDTHILIKELRAIRKRKLSKKSNFDTGARGGKG